MVTPEAQPIAHRGNFCAWQQATVAAFCLALCCLHLQPALAQTQATFIATHATIAGDAASTKFILDLNASIAAEVYTLASPYRVVIDMPDATSSIPPEHAGTGLITSYRTEPLPNRGTRLILHTTGPVEVTGADWLAVTGKQPATAARLQLSLRPTEKAVFGLGSGASLAQTATRAASPPPPSQRQPAQPAITTLVKTPVKPALFDDAATETPAPHSAKPVVMIDPGHGGIDPGAIGPDKVTEKTIVLAVANQTKAALEATGRYDVRLTRTTDVFIPLDSRVALSKQAKADIFISLHADTIDDRQLARSVRGASVYTLSEKASNEDARLMAEKENAADLIAGVTPKAAESGDDVKPILFDLLARETATFSRLLSRSVVNALRKNHPIAHEPERAAAFRVLRQPHAPSVLIELGFLSNPDEEQMMAKAAWQKQVGSAIAAAVASYFSRKGSTMATTPLNGDFGGLPP
ncbi:MAG: N-acetylmuramoyl-L-alanine amidase [Hyphomicrobiaceae bacterium]